MKLNKMVAIGALLAVLASCSDDEISSSAEPDSSEAVEITEENLGAAAPVPDVVGLFGDSIENLEDQVFEAYQEVHPNVQLNSSEPISTIAGVFEVNWDLTGFENSSSDGTRIVAQIRADSPADGQFQIGNAIQQPLCLNDATNCS